MLTERLRQLGSVGKGEAQGIFGAIESTSHGKFATVISGYMRGWQ